MSTIEYRAFEGDAKELSEFLQRTWVQAYGGKVTIPMWGPEFFEWQLYDDRVDAKEFIVAAYDGARLVGLLPCQPVQYDLYGQEYAGSICSWQAVDPEYRRRGISSGTLAEQYRRHLEHEKDFSIGYPFSGTIGTSFWSDSDAGTIRKLGFWFRMLEPSAVAEWETAWWMRWGSRALGALQPFRLEPNDSSGIRPYAPDDLPDCLELVQAMSRESDFSMCWSNVRLEHQLAGGSLPQTLVAEKDGRVAGFINYHLTRYHGRTDITVAIADLIVFGSLSPADRQNLLRSAYVQMKDQGASLSTAPTMSPFSARDMLRAGALAFPGVVRIDYFIGKTTVSFNDAKRIFLICR